MKKTHFFNSLGSMLIIYHKDDVLDAMKKGGEIVLGFAKEGNEIEREETWILKENKYICGEKVFDNLTELEIYMNGDECISITVLKYGELVTKLSLM